MGLLMKLLTGGGDIGEYGTLQIPGKAEVTLPEGKMKINYAESKKSKSDEDTIFFNAPASLVVTVTPAAGGAPLEIKGPGFKGMGSSKSTKKDFSRDMVGSVQVTEPGSYTVTAEGTTEPDAVEPRLMLGK